MIRLTRIGFFEVNQLVDPIRVLIKLNQRFKERLCLFREPLTHVLIASIGPVLFRWLPDLALWRILRPFIERTDPVNNER